jgi:predicted patatin/cPLA2 family phospholipase
MNNIFYKDDIFKCSIAFKNDKKMGVVFENTPSYEKNKKDFENLKNKLNELKNIKKEIEKESSENEIIRKMIKEEENQII